MTSLTVKLQEITNRYKEVCAESGKQQGAVWRLESEVKSLTSRLEQAEAMRNEAIQLYGKLQGYQQRVREEDAAKLGKMWHESRDPNFSNTTWGAQ